jgi:hypothetical protein
MYTYIYTSGYPAPSPSSSIHPHYLIPSHFFIHASIHHHKVPNLLPCTSSSIHLSSLCTHFFIHPFFIHPSSSSRARSGWTSDVSSSWARSAWMRAPSQSPGGQNRNLWRENRTGPGMYMSPVASPLSAQTILVKLMYVRYVCVCNFLRKFSNFGKKIVIFKGCFRHFSK